MIAEPRNSHNINLDFLRGTAALFVLFEHLSKFHLIASNQIQSKSFIASLFYLFRNSGGDAVLVFFVLSGFLVGGSVVETVSKNEWSWIHYAINRLSRLWTVLIPALFFTFFWDSLGKFFNGSGYTGAFFKDLGSGPTPLSLGNLKASSFFENIIFLQTISCPPYGSNGPLWSLANEFWYYLLFPLLILVIQVNEKTKNKILYSIIFLLLIFILPKRMLLLGSVWLFGFVAYWCSKSKIAGRVVTSFTFFIFSAILFILVFFLTSDLFNYPFYLEKILKYGSLPSDGLIGLTFAGTIPFLATHDLEFKIYKNISKWLSNISYSLYLFHFPYLAFFYFCFVLPPALQPSVLNLFYFCLMYLGAIVYSALMWYLFERHTNKIKKYAEKILLRRPQVASGRN